MKLAILFVAACSAFGANVCTPANVAADGFHAAIVNGIDAVDWSLARIQWTSNSFPATQQRIQYATAAQWTATPGVYPQTQGLQHGSDNNQSGTFVNSSATLQGNVLPNLLPSTTYHVIGQSWDGSTWCTATDETFTTLAKPSTTVLPTLPTTFSTTKPTITGTDYIYGSTCGTSGSVTARLQNCFDAAKPAANSTINNGVGLPPGTYNFSGIATGNSNNAIALTLNTGTGYYTQSGAAPANGTGIRFFNPYAPVQQQVKYLVVNSGGAGAGTFQASYDGITPITTYQACGVCGALNYIPYPLSQGWVIVHSTASAANLPPDGVRLDPVAYAASLPNLQLNDPSVAAIKLEYDNSYYYFQNIEFSTDPTVGNSLGTGADPVSFREFIKTSGTNDHVIFNQCAFIPAPPPSRSNFITMDGFNIAYLNSYIQGLDFWQPFREIPASTVSGGTLTIPSGQFYWVGSGGTVGTKQTCNYPGGSLSFSAGTGNFIVWMDNTSCNMKAQVDTTITVSGSSNVTVLTRPGPTVTPVGTTGATTYNYTIVGFNNTTKVYTPPSTATVISNGNASLSGSNYNQISWSAFSGYSDSYNIYRNGGFLANTASLTYNDVGGGTGGGPPQYYEYFYVAPSSSQQTSWEYLNFGYGTVSSGTIGPTANCGSSNPQYYCDQYGLSQNNTESGIGLHSGSGPGPFMVINNTIECTGVCGTFLSDDATNSNTPCGLAGNCSVQYQTGNLTEQRNHVFANPCFFYDAACWNGGSYAWRNLTENKQGGKILRDGNIYGPYYIQVAQGGCLDQLTYYQGFPASTGLVNWVDSSDATITNNTCQYLGGQMSTNPWFTSSSPAMPQRNIYVHNNLFFNDNAYAQTALLSPLEAVITRSGASANCPFGKGVSFGGNGQNFIYDHNTTYGEGGCLTWFFTQFLTLQGGTQFSNNFFNLVSDPGQYSGSLTSGTWAQLNQTFQSTAVDVPSCDGDQGATLLNCLNSFTNQGNVALATWTNSLPGSLAEYNTSQINSAAAYYSGSGIAFPNQNTLALRLANIAWYDPANGNMRLKYTSPYISGSHPSTTDGKDVGVDMDALEAAQGKVSGVHTYSSTSTSTNVGFLAPDSFGCTIDVDPSSDAGNFTPGTFTRVSNAGGQRVQNVSVTGLTAHGLYYLRANCAVSQPVISVQLP